MNQNHRLRDSADPDVAHLRLVVSGRVHGVFYRDSCRQVATRLGLRGSVRNNDDGTVEVVVEGPRDDVDDLVAWCHAGPRRAVVTDVEVTEGPLTGEGPFQVVG